MAPLWSTWWGTLAQYMAIISTVDISTIRMTMREKIDRGDPGPELTPAMFHILLALSDRDRHGYAIMQEVAERTGGEVRLAPGTLYRSIKILQTAGLILESGVRPDPEIDDERRRYYRITDRGRLAATKEAQRLEQLVKQAREKHLLHGDRPAPARGGA